MKGRNWAVNWVYPRVCGGTELRRQRRHLGIGLSPRVRGNRRGCTRWRRWRGSIPACAGEPTSPARRRARRRVYPRVCGGTNEMTTATAYRGGLSPRVRGNRRDGRRPAGATRSIPACAGEPCTGRSGSTGPGVYPRVCGGTRRLSGDCHEEWGLSPRVRGNPARDDPVNAVQGSIPACAGEPIPATGPEQYRQVYPRVCGGTASWSPTPAYPAGLSPRVRGNRGNKSPGRRRTGSIPACAGEPGVRSRSPSQVQVYPRVCGGTILPGLAGIALAGLSPRVRGNHWRGRIMVWRKGSIPACAGEPLGGRVIDFAGQVYPRVCGGTQNLSLDIVAECGLSPRVRGNPLNEDNGRVRAWSIPACAGEP